MEPPFPFISWVNPFPSRFINRTACFPRKVTFFRESRMWPWKKWSWMKRTQEPVLRPFFIFTIRRFLQFYNRWDLGIMKQKLINYPTETKHEAMGQRQPTEDHGKVIFASVLFVFFLPSYIPHWSMHLENSRRLSVLWTSWNFSMISAEKVPGPFDFCHHRGVDFAS